MRSNFLSNIIITDFYYSLNPYTEQYVRNKRVNRPCWSIVIKYEGETIYTSNRKKYISNLNNVIVLPRGSSYEWVCTKSGHYATVEFECNIQSDEIFSFHVKDGNKLLKKMREIEYKQAVKGIMYKQEIIKNLYSIILSMTDEFKQKYVPNKKLDKLTPAINYIATNYNKRIKNDELAKLTGLSTPYFRKLFTEAMGDSPISYMTSLRIKKAQEMLQSDYGSITNIAQSLGYSNIYDFSRDFKKHTGVSPSRY